MKYKDIHGRDAQCDTKRFLYMKIYLICHKIKYRIHVAGMKESIQMLKESKKSIARLADGEMLLIKGESIGYQEYHPVLSRRLREVLSSNQETCLVGLPCSLGQSKLNSFKKCIQVFHNEQQHKFRKDWIQYLDKNQKYCTADITRPYIAYKSRKNAAVCFEQFKEFWKGRKVLIIEGEGTRFGIGNDLLDGATEVKRILCPSENAFRKYDEILNAASMYEKDYLVLAALGPTATVLAYDLSRLGYVAYDIGHLDVEYEWFQAGAEYEIDIENKYVHEAVGGRGYEECTDAKYLKQIVQRI